jgi:hypothetical protein
MDIPGQDVEGLGCACALIAIESPADRQIFTRGAYRFGEPAFLPKHQRQAAQRLGDIPMFVSENSPAHRQRVAIGLFRFGSQPLL